MSSPALVGSYCSLAYSTICLSGADCTFDVGGGANQVHAVLKDTTSDKPNFRAEIVSPFKRIDKLKTERHITLCADATPVCLYPARKSHTPPSVSTNQIGDVHGATGNNLTGDRANQMVFRHGSGAEGKWCSEDLRRSHSPKQSCATRNTPDVVGR